MNIFIPFLISFSIALITAPLVIWLYYKKNWLDDPRKSNHPKVIHDQPLPRGGGLVIFCCIAFTAAVLLPITKALTGVLIGAAVLTAVGFWDDLRDPPPTFRLLAQIIAALIPIGFGIGIAYITNPLGGGVIQLSSPQIAFSFLGATHTIWIISDILALIWIVWCMNIVNFSKGLDGQMPGYVTIASVVIAILSLRFGSDPNQTAVTILSMATAGAYLGFLVFNIYPQKMMSGFGASTLAGYFLAILSILSGGKLATAVLVLAVPMLDATFVIINRVRQGKSPLWGDRTHLHHKLIDLGWSKPKVAIFYWLMAIVLGSFALRLNSEEKIFTIVAAGVIFTGFILWYGYFFQQLKNLGRDNG